MTLNLTVRIVTTVLYRVRKLTTSFSELTLQRKNPINFGCNKQITSFCALQEFREFLSPFDVHSIGSHRNYEN
jgi:hypothetical protein